MPDSPVSEPVELDSAITAAEGALDAFLLGLDEHPYAVYTAEGRDIWRRGVAEEMLQRAGVPAMCAELRKLRAENESLAERERCPHGWLSISTCVACTRAVFCG